MGGGMSGSPVAPILAALARSRQQASPSAPGQGTQANALMAVKSALDMLTNALPGLAAGSEVHRDALQAITRLSRHMPQGEPTAGVQQTQLQDMLRQLARNALLQRVMAQRQAGAPGGDAGQGAPQPPPTPTPAMPGG